LNPTQSLIAACAAMVLLTGLVGLKMLQARVAEMRRRRIHPQAVALSAQRVQRLEDTRASDNYSNLLELPVLFYVLCLAAIAIQHIPGWLPAFAWLFVGTRVLHSVIQCTYNKVMHRFYVFLAGFFLVAALWLAFVVSILAA